MNTFDDLNSQLLDEERKLRHMAERQSRAYSAVLHDLALRLAPQALDRLRRGDPHAGALTPEQWREMLFSALPGHGSGSSWLGDNAANMALVADLRRQLAQLTAEIGRLQAENALLAGKLEQVAKESAAAPRPAGQTSETKASAPAIAPASMAEEEASLSVPASAPTKWHKRIPASRWPRAGLIIAYAAQGWALQYAIAEAIAKQDDKLQSGSSGSLKRLFAWIEKTALIKRLMVTRGKSRWIVVTLTKTGQEVAKAIGYEPVENDWSRMLRLHGGEAQQKHALLTVLFTSLLRLRGWQIEVCPAVEGPAEPDVLIRKGGERIYVEVEGESGTEARRTKKWRNMARLQGFVALCAPDEATRTRLEREAKSASKHGKATDIKWLLDNEGIWAETW